MVWNPEQNAFYSPVSLHGLPCRNAQTLETGDNAAYDNRSEQTQTFASAESRHLSISLWFSKKLRHDFKCSVTKECGTCYCWRKLLKDQSRSTLPDITKEAHTLLAHTQGMMSANQMRSENLAKGGLFLPEIPRFSQVARNELRPLAYDDFDYKNRSI